MLLKDEFSFMPKSKIKAGEGKDEGLYPFFTSSDVKVKRIDNYLFNDELVVLGTGGMPSCNYFNGKFAVSTDNFVLKSKGRIKPKYLYYFLRHNNLSILAAGFRGTGLKHISKEYTNEIDIPYKEPNIQKELIDVADVINILIDNCKKELQLYDEMVKSRFNELFGNPVINNKNWGTVKLKSITTKIGSGATPKGGKGSYPTKGISFIRSMNVYDGIFDYNELAHLNDSQANKLRGVTIYNNDILFNITGASISRTCIVPDDVLPARVNQHVSIIRLKNGVNHIFINHLLFNKHMKDKLLGIGESSGATRQAITKTDLEELDIILPQIELQNVFASFVEQIDKLKFIEQNQSF
ncbi:MAG: restriction endonuclease subunit S [Clostridia bacterium]|nr:restriction endonuclease subunit S [Clostridia bacterium]